MNPQLLSPSTTCSEKVPGGNYRSGTATQKSPTCDSHKEHAGSGRTENEAGIDWCIAQQSAIYQAAVDGYLPRLCMLAERVAASYQNEFPTLGALSADCAEFYRLLKIHLHTEEALLFPLLRDLDDTERGRRINLNSLAVCVRAAQADCRELLALLDRIREQAKRFPSLSESASMLGVLLRSVNATEENSRRHLDRELNLLLVRASEMIDTGRKTE